MNIMNTTALDKNNNSIFNSLDGADGLISNLYKAISEQIQDPRNPFYVVYDLSLFMVILLIARLAGKVKATKVEQYWERHASRLSEIL